MFAVMLQMAKMGNYHLMLPGITSSSSPMDMIEAILLKAVDHYDMIAEGGGWNIPNQQLEGAYTVTQRCWNCEEIGCNVKI